MNLTPHIVWKLGMTRKARQRRGRLDEVNSDDEDAIEDARMKSRVRGFDRGCGI